MRSKFLTLALVSILTLGTTTERAGADPTWDLIRAVEVTEVEEKGIWRVKKSFPDALRSQSGDFSITGYYVPVQAQGFVTQFLLVPNPADCPFCGSSGYGISLEVHVTKPMPDIEEGTELTVSGRLELVESDETYQAVVLRDASVLR